MIRLCLKSEVPIGRAKNFNIDGIELSIFHTDDGFIARSGVCKHNGFKLELCSLQDCIVTCPLHGWKYDVKSGKGIKPAHTFLDIYEIEIRGNEIWVDIRSKEVSDLAIDTSKYQW